jgi:argininosuccinate lyase
LSHWWLSHFWALQRDRQRLKPLWENTAVLPLGSAALAGTTFPIDRASLALDLGFAVPSQNSLDAVSDRDFAAELLFWNCLTGIHLSRLADAIILYTSAEFGFMELTDAYSTGSSLMPQKRNPDVFELTRGKAGTLIGLLTGLLATLKGLPSAYDKDLQEDKAPVFAAVDTVLAILPVMAGAINSLTIHTERMAAAIDASMMATDIADYLVKKGIPFRQAYTLVGIAVRLCANRKISLNDLTSAEWQDIHPSIEPDVLTVLDPVHSINCRSVIGGTAQLAVEQQIKSAQQALEIKFVAQI